MIKKTVLQTQFVCRHVKIHNIIVCNAKVLPTRRKVPIASHMTVHFIKSKQSRLFTNLFQILYVLFLSTLGLIKFLFMMQSESYYSNRQLIDNAHNSMAIMFMSHKCLVKFGAHFSRVDTLRYIYKTITLLNGIKSNLNQGSHLCGITLKYDTMQRAPLKA